jgi:prepilin signal peptidase PulO-like enzyme (type II secretory pathway)
MHFIFFLFGLFLGSLLNNIALRLEKEENFLFSRSKCPYCGKILSWKELIPILSFLIQKGKCKNCKQKISLRYPLVELITGFWVYFLAKSLLINFSPIIFIEFLFYLIFLSLLFVLALYDLKTFLVDDKLIIFGLFVFLLFFIFKIYFNLPSKDFTYLFNYLFTPLGKFEPFFSAIFLSFIFLIIYLLTRGQGLGFGDVKVVFLIGLFLRPGDALISITIASFLGSLYGLYLVAKNKNFKQPIPFIPFFFLGVFLTIILGYPLTKFYFSLLP